MADTDYKISVIFFAQTKNVKELEIAWKNINRTIHAAYISNEFITSKIQTHLLSLVYCAYAEAVFSKLIHTPCCFSLNEISQIKSAGSSNIVEGWKKCIELAFHRVEGNHGNHKPNAIKLINKLVDTYIYDPSILRNKLAHGQWCLALNRSHSSINQELSDSIASIDSVDLFRFKKAFQSLYRIIEDLIESPNKTHRRDYWSHICEFEEEQEKIKEYSIEDKILQLKNKASRKHNVSHEA